MADSFDPYREALVVETATVWPDEKELDFNRRFQLEAALHAHPEQAEQIKYLRMHSGFCRTIYVTEGDLERVNALVS